MVVVCILELGLWVKFVVITKVKQN